MFYFYLYFFFHSRRQCQVCRCLLLSAGVGPGWSWLLGKSVRQLVAKQEASLWPCLCTLFRLFHGPADGLRRCFLHPPEYAGQCRPTRLCHVICFPGQLGSMKRFSFFFEIWIGLVSYFFILLLFLGWIELDRPWPTPGSRSWFSGDFETRPRLSLLAAQPRSQLPCQIRWQARIFSSTASDVLCRQRYQQLVDYQETKQVRHEISIWFMAKRVFEWLCLISFLVVRTDLAVAAPLDRISHGEEVQLVHGITGRNLNSHNVAAPASPTKQVRPWIFNWYPKMVRWSFSNDLRRTTLTSGM